MKTNGENQELQRLMNARLWRCVEEYGGAQELSRDSGLNPQTLYNMRDNRTFPSTPTIKVIKRTVPRLSLDAIYSDSESLEWDAAPGTNLSPAIVAQATTAAQEGYWKLQAQKLESKLDDLSRQHTKLVNAILKEKMGLELDFLRSGSQTTVLETETIGFRQQQRINGTDYTKSDRPMIRVDISQAVPVRMRRL